MKSRNRWFVSLRAATGVAVALVATWAHAQFDGPAPLAWRWAQTSTVPPGGSPIISGDRVYVAVGSRMYSLDLATGNQVWRYPAADPLPANFRRGAVITQGLLIAGADNKMVYAADAATGVAKWQFTAPEPITSEVLADGPVAVVMFGDSQFQAIDVTSGVAAWREPLKIEDGVLGSPILFRNRLIVCTQSFEMLAIDLDTKRVAWRTRFSELGPDVKPTVFGDLIVVNSGDFVIAVNGNGGGVRWQRNAGTPLSSSPTVTAEGVFVVTRDGTGMSFDPSGRTMMRTPLDFQSSVAAPPVGIGRYALVPTLNGSINMVDIKAGSLIWNYIVRPLPGSTFAPSASQPAGGSAAAPAGPPTFVTVAGSPVVSGDTMIVIARDGSILAFDKKNGVDLTPPTVRMLFPNPGDQVNPNPPFQLAFRVEDEASGVNFDLAKVTIDGIDYTSRITREGILTVQFGGSSNNPVLTDGRKTILVRVYDWMGNRNDFTFVVAADSSLRLSGPPSATPPAGGGGRGGGGV
ncbi:MAG TPA: PQQ-binding-like beta-propeller repeat protein [Fimbriimonadaceae bacterium]|nr:PQQ-binding-like beta-propeller repeat protein [Fimbriimonadaceae bacterium]HRJ33271.1 PQQ-binding-like beta-propeller repeat protein [Fimbriimonadaceae bacterium]